MAAVLTTSMTLRIILAVRGSLTEGGSFLGTSAASHTNTSSRSTHVLSARSGAGVIATPSLLPPTYTLDGMRPKAEPEWSEVSDGKNSVIDGKGPLPQGGVNEAERPTSNIGVKITIDREIEYDNRLRYARTR
jgi:hypothetical protein